ncbi:MAG: LPS export ABC transporter ATP-binding protein [Parvibaculales bacterium]
MVKRTPPIKRKAPQKRERPVLVSQNNGLEIRNIGKSYRRRPVVRNVSLALQRGEALGLLGANGAGKTTIFYMITGLIAPDYGTIALDGADITDIPMYQRARMGLGYLPQESSVFRGLCVEDNLRSVLERVESDAVSCETRLEELLGEFSITHLRRTPSIALSGGERRRVEIARALAMNPTFILMDEPFAGIDPIAIGEIRELVIQLKNNGIGVLITDHNVREALEILDRAVIIHDGGVLMEGTPKEIIRHDEVRSLYLGADFSL